MGINNLKNILGNNKDKVRKFVLGLLGTAAGLALAGVFTKEEGVEFVDLDEVTENAAEEESSEETTTEIVEG